ncbi:unnamed protein product [Anisakis simplex]|uniref:Flocculation protein FLO11-like n=1 Tax=Anisakis simplex TaxID=6269 RepID=A0A0M3JTI2_ANISI|nr:unnamed protein product [Anisakis simplex]
MGSLTLFAFGTMYFNGRPHSRHITRDMLKQELNETIISTAAKSTQQQVATINNDPLAQQDLPAPSHQPPLTATVPSDESAPPEIRKVSRFTVQRIQNALQPPINPSTAQQSPVFTPPATQTNQNQSSTPSTNESARPPAQRRSRFTVNKVPESALQSQSAPPTANNPPTTGLESNQPAQPHAPLEFSQQIASQQPNAALQFSASPLFRLPTQNMTPTLSVVVEEPENEDAEQVQPESALRETNKRPLLSTPATPMIPVGGGKDDSNRANSFLTQSSVDKNVSPWTTLLVSPGEALLSFVVEHPTDHRTVPSPQDTTPQLHNAPQHNQHRVTTKFNELYEKVIDECNQTEAIFERFSKHSLERHFFN